MSSDKTSDQAKAKPNLRVSKETLNRIDQGSESDDGDSVNVASPNHISQTCQTCTPK
jgi:hypothetical protein